MENNVYDNIEKDIKKYKYFGREDLPTDISMLIASFLIVGSTILLLTGYTTFGWIIFGVVIACLCLLNCIFPSVTVFKYFKYSENRILIKNKLSEMAKTNKYAKKFLKNLDFSRPLKRIYFFDIGLLSFLENIILRLTRPSILEIIKTHGINSNRSLKEVIAHYRFTIATKKTVHVNLVAILSLIATIISMFAKNLILAATIISVVYIFIIGIYIAILNYKRTFAAPYSKKTFYKKLELALSEIYVSNILTEEMHDKHRAQFGFTSHQI